ncbi:MAG: polysaccharide deacetylase family protein, partial [Anaerolineales bacterium]
RHTAQNFNDIFRPYWEKWKWPVVNAWINANDDTGRIYLPENVALSKEGWVDYQSHGVLHLPIEAGSSEDFIHNELYGSMQAMQANFGKTPIAYIWAGGNFTPHAVQMARQAGYKLGFTINPRGPVMFNWIPQTDQADTMRPSFLAEGPAGDPLLTLPRYWDTDARAHLDTVRNIGKAAAAYAQKNKTAELEYYDIVCAPTYGAIPNP